MGNEQTEISADGKTSTLRDRTLTRIREAAERKNQRLGIVNLAKHDEKKVVTSAEERWREAGKLLDKYRRKYKAEWKTMSPTERDEAKRHIDRLTEEANNYIKFCGREDQP